MMCPVSHAQNAILARKIIHAAMRGKENLFPTHQVEQAAHDCMEGSPTMTLKAFLEGAGDECWLKPSTVRTCWYRARRERNWA